MTAAGQRVPPVGAIQAIQEAQGLIALSAVAAVLARLALVKVAEARPAAEARLRSVEQEVLAPLPGRPLIERLPPVVAALPAAVGGLLLLLGTIEDYWVGIVVLVAFYLLGLARRGVIPFPPEPVRSSLSRVPLLGRFLLALFLVTVVTRQLLDAAARSGDSFQFMLWPVLIAAAIFVVLMSGPSASAEPPADRLHEQRP